MNQDLYIKLENNISFYGFLLKEFSKAVNLKTGVREKPFTIFVEDKKLYVQPLDKKIILLRVGATNDFYELFKESGSVESSYYRKVTTNASYFLAIIKYLQIKYSVNEIQPISNILNKNFSGILDYEEGYVLNVKDLIIRKDDLSFSINLKWGDSGCWNVSGLAKKQNNMFVSEKISGKATDNPNSEDDGNIFTFSIKDLDEDSYTILLTLDINVIYHRENHIFKGDVLYEKK